MSNQVHKGLSAALLKMLRPLASVLTRHGMVYGTFAELARKAFVDAAFEDGANSKKRPTVSSVSAVTGLTRKETKRLRELDLLEDDSSVQRYGRATRIISAWVNDPRFHDDTGQPAILPMDGEQGSFSALVKEFSGDIPTVAMLSVLESSDSVARVAQGVALRSRAYIPSDTPLDKINILGTDAAELIATIGHNLDAGEGDKYFQRKVSNISLRLEDLDAFRQMSNRKSQQLLEEYHAWLSAHEVDVDDSVAQSDQKSCYVAVGIYYSQQLEPDTTELDTTK